MKGRVSPKQMLSWVKDVAEALAYAHEQGVVHRDVKPANVLIDGHGQPFVMDFGLAKEVDLTTKEGSRKATLTAAGAVMGTPMYMSPEQASGRTELLGPATDQFSLGVMLYQMLTKRLPFQGRSSGELFIAIMQRDAIAPSKVNPKVHRDVETICMKALEKDPKKRYGSMKALAADLAHYMDGEPIQARPLGMAERLSRGARKRRGVVQATCALIVVGLISIGYAKWQSSRAAVEVTETKSQAEKDKSAYQDQIRHLAGNIDELRKSRDFGKARRAYEEILKARQTGSERKDLEGKIEETRLLEELQDKLAKAVSAARKEKETLNLSDGKSVIGNVLMADAEKIIVYSEGSSIEVPWGAITDADYKRMLHEYLAQPDEETAYGLGVYALGQGDAEWAKACFLRIVKDPALVAKAEARLASLGVETDAARQRHVSEEQQKKEMAVEAEKQTRAEEAWSEWAPRVWRLAKERRWNEAIEECKKADAAPTFAPITRRLLALTTMITRGRGVQEAVIQALKGQVACVVTLARRQGDAIKAMLVSVSDAGVCEMELETGNRAKATTGIKWTDLSTKMLFAMIQGVLQDSREETDEVTIEGSRITLDDGTIVEGKLVEDRPDLVVIRTAKGNRQIPHDRCKRIDPIQIPALEFATADELYLSEVRSLDAKDGKAQLAMGTFCIRVRLFEKAKEHFDVALLIDPNLASDVREAMTALERANKESEARVLLDQAKAALSAGDFQEACECTGKLAREYAGTTTEREATALIQDRAILALVMGDVDDADPLLQQLRKSGSSDWCLVTTGIGWNAPWSAGAIDARAKERAARENRGK